MDALTTNQILLAEGEKPKRNETIEKWLKYYQEKNADEARQAGIAFKDLDKYALEAEMQYYESIVCKTKHGDLSISDLKILFNKAGSEILGIDCDDKDAIKKQKKKIDKPWRQIINHPIYPMWHTCSEAIRALKSIEKLPEEVREQIL